MRMSRVLMVIAFAIYGFQALAADTHEMNSDAAVSDQGRSRVDSALSFAELGRYFRSEQASTDVGPHFSLKDGECVVNPAHKVSTVFKRQRFGASLTQDDGPVFSTRDLGASPDETFHEGTLRIGYRSPKTGGDLLHDWRQFTIGIDKEITIRQPRRVLGIPLGTTETKDIVTRDHNVTITQDTRKLVYQGRPSIVLEARGSGSFGWNETPLYYCVFPDK